MKIFAETERLILREIVQEDLESMFELDSDPEVHRFLGNHIVTDRKETERIIAFVRQQYLENGFGRWAMAEKSTSRFIGWCGLKRVKETVNNHSDYVDLGYRILRPYWGKGFATESAQASLNYGFETLHLDEIFAAAQTGNLASNKILTKTGFRLIETFHYDGAVHNWYNLTFAGWKRDITNL